MKARRISDMQAEKEARERIEENHKAARRMAKETKERIERESDAHREQQLADLPKPAVYAVREIKKEPETVKTPFGDALAEVGTLVVKHPDGGEVIVAREDYERQYEQA